MVKKTISCIAWLQQKNCVEIGLICFVAVNSGHEMMFTCDTKNVYLRTTGCSLHFKNVTPGWIKRANSDERKNEASISFPNRFICNRCSLYFSGRFNERDLIPDIVFKCFINGWQCPTLGMGSGRPQRRKDLFNSIPGVFVRHVWIQSRPCSL